MIPATANVPFQNLLPSLESAETEEVDASAISGAGLKHRMNGIRRKVNVGPPPPSLGIKQTATTLCR